MVSGTGFPHAARRAKHWTIAGAGGFDISAALACSRQAIIALVLLWKAVAASR
jgi:hypothetical protein